MSEAIRKFILALAAQIPLAGGLYLKWNQVQQRPLLSATIGLLYELTVVAWAFWKKVWAELEKDAIKATADWARAAARNFKPGFRRRYNKEIIHEYGVFNVRGLGLINAFTLKLDQVFINLRIAPSGNPQRAGMDPIAIKELVGNRPIWDFLRVRRGKDELESHLKSLQRCGLIKTWHDRKIEVGNEWKQEIDENLELADIVLLLVSADFMASDYCYETEMTKALERHEQSQARVIPIIVRDVNWAPAPFAKLQALPANGLAVTKWQDRDSAWRHISEEIEKVARNIQQSR